MITNEINLEEWRYYNGITTEDITGYGKPISKNTLLTFRIVDDGKENKLIQYTGISPINFCGGMIPISCLSYIKVLNKVSDIKKEI